MSKLLPSVVDVVCELMSTQVHPPALPEVAGHRECRYEDFKWLFIVDSLRAVLADLDDADRAVFLAYLNGKDEE